jgi:hypothetical protein
MTMIHYASLLQEQPQKTHHEYCSSNGRNGIILKKAHELPSSIQKHVDDDV